MNDYKYLELTPIFLLSNRKPAMNRFRYFSDFVNSVAAFSIGITLAFFLHNKWYYGGWMAIFGDPPNINPAYGRLACLFEMAPYVAGGLATGLVAGFGYPEFMRIFIRFGSVVLLAFLSLTRNWHLG
ncbi:MAG: hypothetical protein WCD79_13990, partial [Chthoniobacteraceae bacterium]